MIRNCLLVWASLTMGGAWAGDVWPEMDFPEHAKVEIVADNMSFSALPMKTWAVTDSGSMGELKQFYVSRWKPRSEKFNEQEFNGDYVINSWQPPYLFTARFKAQFDSTLIYVAVSKVMSPDEYSRSTGIKYPTLSDTLVISDISSADLFKRGRTVILLSDRKVSENYHYYRNYYTSRGWSEVVGIFEVSANKAVLRMAQNNNYLDISLSSHNGKTHIVSNEMSEGI
ncbi:hypothetical protein [Shewanella cyperi]|uniref:hypothetical protein n=1 Tax=Shewanella cyperi TaxID=2814292 RepID=UPI001A9417BC|nr:hypothetical protein [Shewanella cyperi]QSX40164.1 hypothetical protein JYB84_14470 [Shewanella cyperi]